MAVLTPEQIYQTGINRAVNLAGGVSHLAKALSISRIAVYGWLRRGYTPPIRAIQIEELYGVKRTDLINPVLLHGTLDQATGGAPVGRARGAEDLV